MFDVGYADTQRCAFWERCCPLSKCEPCCFVACAHAHRGCVKSLFGRYGLSLPRDEGEWCPLLFAETLATKKGVLLQPENTSILCRSAFTNGAA